MKSFGEDEVVGCGVDGWGDEEKNGGSDPRCKIVGVPGSPDFEGEPNCMAVSISRRGDKNGNRLLVVKVAPTPKGIVYLALYRL